MSLKRHAPPRPESSASGPSDLYGSPAGVEEQRRVTMMLDELERELVTQRTAGHRHSGSISQLPIPPIGLPGVPGSTNRSSAAAPIGPPPSEPLPQLPSFPSSSSRSGSRLSSSTTRVMSSVSGTTITSTSTPATSIRAPTTEPEPEAWINSLAGPRASSTFSRTSFDSTHHDANRYTLCAADDDDDGNLSDHSRVLSLSNYHSFSNHEDPEMEHRRRSNEVEQAGPVPPPKDFPSPSAASSSKHTMHRPQGSEVTISVPTVMIDDVDELSDDTADMDDSDDDGRRKRRKKPSRGWRFEDQRALAPTLSRATAARLGAPSSSRTAPSLPLGSSSHGADAAMPGAPPLAPGMVVPPTASEFSFYEFAPDLPPFAPKDLTPKDLTGTGTWRSIVARAAMSAATNSQRGSIASETHSGPVSVRQIAAETRARQQRELVMRQRQAQLFAQTTLEPVDLHKHAHEVASTSDRGMMSPSPSPSFSTMDDDDQRSHHNSSIHRGLFRSTSVSLSGYWDPLESISSYGGGGGAGSSINVGDEDASVRSSTYTNPGLGFEFMRQQGQQNPAVKVYADSGTQTSPNSSPPTSRPGSPAAAEPSQDTGGAEGDTRPDLPVTPRKGASTATEGPGARSNSLSTPQNRAKADASPKAGTSKVRPAITRRRSTLGTEGRSQRGADLLGTELRKDEPDGWATPLRAPKLSSRRSNIGTSPRVSSARTSPRTSVGLARKPLSPMGLGIGMNKEEFDMFNGLSQQTEGSDAGISSDGSDSDVDSCESDLDLDTPLEELAERSGALEADARGEKRKFDAQRQKGASGKAAHVAALATPSKGRLGPNQQAGRIVAPLPRGLRQAAKMGKLGPSGQVGGRALGAGLRAGAIRTTAVAYSSDDEDVTETESVIGSSIPPALAARLRQHILQNRIDVSRAPRLSETERTNSLSKGGANQARSQTPPPSQTDTATDRQALDENASTPTMKSNKVLASAPDSSPKMPMRKGLSIPELDEILKAESETNGRSTPVGSGGKSFGRVASKISAQEDDDLLTSDIDLAMPPSGESFQSIDDLDGLLDSPHNTQMKGYGVRSVTGTASLRKPISVPALVTERLAQLHLSEGSGLTPSSPAADRTNGSSTAAEEEAYASSTVHGHSIVKRNTQPEMPARLETPLSKSADLKERKATQGAGSDAVEQPVQTPDRSASRASKDSQQSKSSQVAESEMSTPTEKTGKQVEGSATNEVRAPAPTRERSKSNISRIRPPMQGRTSLPTAASARKNSTDGSSALDTAKATSTKGVPVARASSIAASTDLSNHKTLRKMKSFGDRSSNSYQSPSISTMPRARFGAASPADSIQSQSSASSRPGSGFTGPRQSGSSLSSRPPSSTSMRRTALPARKNSDALPSSLPLLPGSTRPSAGTPTSKIASSTAKSQSSSVSSRPSQGATPSKLATAPAGRAAKSSSSAASTNGDSPQSQDTPTLSSRASSVSSTDSPPMPSTPGPQSSSIPSPTNRRAASTTNLRKSGVPRPSALPMPKSHRA